MMFKRDANLQTMCLNVVADKINIFSIPCPAIEIYITFLRRCYSDNLYELINKKYDSKEYLVWLISPHWKNVSLNGIGYDYSDVVLKMKSVGENITSLSMKDTACSHGILSAIICCLPNLTFLNLSGLWFKDHTLQLIRKMCPNLHTLDLSNCCFLTHESLRSLCYFNDKYCDYPSLKVLNLSNTELQIKDMFYILDYFTSLEILNNYYLPNIVYNMHILSKVYIFRNKIVPQKKFNFTYCEYRSPEISLDPRLNLVLESYSNLCPFTNHIFIQSHISKDTFQELTEFECLKKLNILNMVNSLTQATSISPFLTIKGAVLTHLDISQLSVSADVITNSCPNLEDLSLCRVKFEDFNPPVINNRKIPSLKRLKALVIKHIRLDEDLPLKSISLIISSSENLTDLSIQYSKHFTDTVADVILKLPNLLTVDFSFTDIKPETLLRFFTQPDISKICTDGCPNISLDDETSYISKLMSDTPYENTCSWVINYSELFKKHEKFPFSLLQD